MAESTNKITFSIGSVFSGEGFDKAAKATAQTSKDVAGLSHSLLSLAQQFGLMDGPVGRFVNGVVSAGKAVSEFARNSKLLHAVFSPVGLAVAGITAAVAGCVASFKMLKEHHEEMTSAIKSSLTTYEQQIGAFNRLQKSIEGARQAALDREYGPRIEQAKEEAKAVDEVAKSYAALAAAEASVSGAKGQLEIARLTTEFNEKLRAAADELDKGVIAAERDLALAQKKNAVTLDAASEAAEAQHQSLLSLNQKIAAQQDLIESMTAAGKDTEKEETALQKMLQDRSVQEKKVEAADLALETARVKAAEDEAAQSAALAALRRSTAEAKEARDLSAKEEAEYAEALKNAKDAAVDEWNRQNARKDALEAEAATTQKRITTYEEYAKSVAAAVEAQKDFIKQGIATDAAVHQGITGQGYQYSLDAEGNPDNFIDWQRAQRYGERAERDAENRARRDDAAAKRYQNLVDKEGRGGKMTDSELEWMNDFENYVTGKDAKGFNEIVDGIIGDQKKTLSDLNKEIDEIKTKLNDLGLK